MVQTYYRNFPGPRVGNWQDPPGSVRYELRKALEYELMLTCPEASHPQDDPSMAYNKPSNPPSTGPGVRSVNGIHCSFRTFSDFK